MDGKTFGDLKWQALPVLKDIGWAQLKNEPGNISSDGEPVLEFISTEVTIVALKPCKACSTGSTMRRIQIKTEAGTSEWLNVFYTKKEAVEGLGWHDKIVLTGTYDVGGLDKTGKTDRLGNAIEYGPQFKGNGFTVLAKGPKTPTAAELIAATASKK
jgi:hypothetical protein